MDEELRKISHFIVQQLLASHQWIATAESCTGGGLAAALTSVPGSSGCVRGGIVAYTEEVKQQLLGVQASTLREYGVVSRETAVEMAKGAMDRLKTDYAVASTGIAGPSGGTPDTPVGTIWLAVATPDEIITYCIRNYDEGRAANTQNAILKVLKMLSEKLKVKEKQR